MSELLDEFFAGLEEAAAGRLPAPPRGTIQFTFVGTDTHPATWFVRLESGRVVVARTGADADCVVEMRPETFERLLAGADNVVSMLFRGVVSVEGDLSLFLIFRRLLPIEADSANPEPVTDVSRTAERFRTDIHESASIFYGNLFMISDRHGDIAPEPTPLGLFFFDTRFLSTWRLTVDGERLAVLSIDDISSAEAKFALVPGQPTHYVNATTSVLRHRWVAQTFEEELTLFNFAPEPLCYTVRLDVGADFAEVQEIRDGYQRDRQVSTTIDERSLRLHYRRETLHRETVISASEPADIDGSGLTFTVTVAPHGTWSTRLRVLTLVRDLRRRDLRERLESSTGRSRAEASREVEQTIAGMPRLRSDHEPLSIAYDRSVRDLAALTYQGLNFRERLPATGLPWSMTLLARESLISCLQVLPFLPQRALSTLRILALSQGVRVDPFRGEQPGRIVQESRYGESAAFNDAPDSAAFSAVDTTPLFVVLLDEYERWTGDDTLVRTYEFQARAALAWIDEYAGRAGDGYVWSTCRQTRTGPANETWRSSVHGICFSDGRLATFPQAICETQGYVYDAKRRAARLARSFWGDPGYADQLEREAAALRERFDRDFWLPDRGRYALALQSDRTPVDGLASNLGHLLWSGIVAPERAGSVVRHLTGPALWSGWGVRTLASTEFQFNPLGHHTGAIWPADNSLIAWGLRRYGFKQEAARIASALLEAGQHFQGRLPALFAGYDRARTRVPVPHRFTDSPYAPSAGATLLLLRTLLGLEPYENHLGIDAGVPEELGQIELLDIRGRWGYADALGRGRPISDRPPS
ncbi:glycogen debranching N-terminal domain-containing protein [Micromonospora cathayae]|uniref:Glycogen debranching N-terminal domain-containing protein n=1 Tax=Micromonospora cathayae TaxID=3028804 RepID=A0ABY7ZMR8_9ACTN|nr:glycogen debranching N-terminal domain-containing protein [Micromonospora sp. HUAS 3]WDZ83547.1 glycogen debranching N-terminal domain-containing protein [Micromonospora sp. HUAS 3]